MSAKETIPTTLTPPVKPKRPKPADKAHELLRGQSVAAASFRPLVKITTKVLPEHVEWLKEQIARYGLEHPRAPRLTQEELMQIAVDELRHTTDLDERIRRYRS